MTLHRDTAVLRAAAQWLVRLHSGRADARDHAACQDWRAADPAHELAWQRAELLSRKFGAVPRGLGAPVLVRQARPHRRAALRTLALLATTAPAAWLGWRQLPWQRWTADHQTAAGERRELTLPDGSRVLLDTASAIDLRFDPAERLLRLREGAIAVITAPDAQSPARPFLVETPLARLRALGTRFTVRQQQADWLVAVTEGAVEARLRDDAALVIPAGQQSLLTPQGAGPLQPLSPASQDWVQGVLVADGMRLADVCAELARYRPGLLQCAPEVAELRVSGAFQLRDTDYVLAMLASTLPVRVLMHTRYWVRVLPA